MLEILIAVPLAASIAAVSLLVAGVFTKDKRWLQIGEEAPNTFWFTVFVCLSLLVLVLFVTNYTQ